MLLHLIMRLCLYVPIPIINVGNSYTWCSCSRWRMWAWGCGWENLIIQNLLSMFIAWISVNLDALKIITLHITNLQDKWHVYGINWKVEENLSAATHDDNDRHSRLNLRIWWRNQSNKIVVIALYMKYMWLS